MKQEDDANWKREAFAQAVGFAAALVVGAGVAFFIGIASVGLVVGELLRVRWLFNLMKNN